MMHRLAPASYLPQCVHQGLAIYGIGQGDPVLLMPGPHRFQQPGDGSAAPLIEGLIRLGRRVISFDPPGSGHSTRASHLSMAEIHECADETLDQSNIRGRIDGMGHSMGGLCMLAYALARPARIRRLVLVGTGSGGPAYMNAPGALWNRTHPAFWRMALLGILHIVWPCQALQNVMVNFIERHSYVDKRWVTPQPILPSDWFRTRQAHTEWHRIARKLNYRARLGAIEAPTLLLCGRHDPQFPPACTQELAEAMKSAHAVLFEQSGHYPFIEESSAFWPVVGAFLQRSLAETTQATTT